jgi:hypothetical protein
MHDHTQLDRVRIALQPSCTATIIRGLSLLRSIGIIMLLRFPKAIPHSLPTHGHLL